MDGDSQKRFCGSCQKHVHNLSEMDAKSAKQLLASRDAKVCVRVRRNADGSVVTRDNDLSRRSWFSKSGATAAGLMMFLFGGCRDPFVQGEPEMMGDAVMMGEACPEDFPEQLADYEEVDAANNANDVTKALTENPWRLTSPGFAFELESTANYELLPFIKQQAEFGDNWGSFVEFKDGKFNAYNSTMCGNDVSVSVTGTYESIGANKIKIFVKHISRNEYCKKKSESPEKSYGVYNLSQAEDGQLRIAKD